MSFDGLIDMLNHISEFTPVYLFQKPTDSNYDEDIIRLVKKHGEKEVLEFLGIYFGLVKREIKS